MAYITYCAPIIIKSAHFFPCYCRRLWLTALLYTRYLNELFNLLDKPAKKLSKSVKPKIIVLNVFFIYLDHTHFGVATFVPINSKKTHQNCTRSLEKNVIQLRLLYRTFRKKKQHLKYHSKIVTNPTNQTIEKMFSNKKATWK